MIRIRDFLKRRGVTKSLLAGAAGVHPNTLRTVHDAEWNPTAKTLDALDAAVSRLEKAMTKERKAGT